MHNHFHLVASAKNGISLSDILRDFKKFTSKQVIKAIEENPKWSSSNEVTDFSSHKEFEVILRNTPNSGGSIGQSNPEFKKFMGFSIRSLAEVVTCLHKARRRKYITEEEFAACYEFSYNLMNMMVGFRNKII